MSVALENGIFPTGFLFVTASVRKALSTSNAFPLRKSLDPVFSIELESDFFSVFSAFLPTVSLPFVVSTVGISFFSTGLFLNFELTVITSLL